MVDMASFVCSYFYDNVSTSPCIKVIFCGVLYLVRTKESEKIMVRRLSTSFALHDIILCNLDNAITPYLVKSYLLTEEKKMDLGTILLLCFLGFLVVISVCGYVYHLKSKEKVKGEAVKKKLQNILVSMVPTGEYLTVAYAYGFQPDRERSYTTTYLPYAIGFNEEHIYVVQLRFEAGEIYYKDSICIEKSIVGKVESDVLARRIRLFDKMEQEIVHLQVEAKNKSNYGNGDIHLAQEAEAKAFEEWVVRWTSEINQTQLNKQFASNFDTYRENINPSAASARNENGCTELLQCVRKIKDEDKKVIWKLLDNGRFVEAIRQIQIHTGLGLADCKKIADNPHMYL